MFGPILKMCEISVNQQERNISEDDISANHERNAKDLRGLIRLYSGLKDWINLKVYL